MSGVYTTGNSFNKKYWIKAKHTACFITFQRLRWSEDFVNEKGVMFPTAETVRVKDGRHLYKKGIGFFHVHDDPRNPIEVRPFTKPTNEEAGKDGV